MLDLVIHPSAEPEHQVEGALLLDVVVREGSSVLQLLASKDEPLLIRGNSFLVLRIKEFKHERKRRRGEFNIPGFWP